MNRAHHHNLTFLMSIIALFMVSVGILQGTKPRVVDQGVDVDDSGNKHKIILKKEDARDYVETFLRAGNIQKAMQGLAEIDDAVAVMVIHDLVLDSRSSLSTEQQIDLIFAAAQHYADNKKVQQEIFSLMTDYRDHWLGAAILFDGVRGAYVGAVPAVIEYLKSLPENAGDSDKSLLALWGRESLTKAIEENDVESFKKLVEMGIVSSPEFARKLISFVIIQQKSPDFICYIIRTMHIDPNIVLPGSITFLMLAARENNKQAAQMLLDCGADPHFEVSGKKAVDIAFKEGSVDVELILRLLQQDKK